MAPFDPGITASTTAPASGWSSRPGYRTCSMCRSSAILFAITSAARHALASRTPNVRMPLQARKAACGSRHPPNANQRDRLHGYYRIEGGNHVDSLVDLNPRHLRPMLPCFRAAFDALTAWVEDGREPPASSTVPRPAGNGATDPVLLNSSSL